MIGADGLNGELPGLTFVLLPMGMHVSVCTCVSVQGSKAGKDWGQEEKGATEGEMVGWQHQLKGPESE